MVAAPFLELHHRYIREYRKFLQPMLLFSKGKYSGKSFGDVVKTSKRGCNFIGVDNDLSAILTTEKRCQLLGLHFKVICEGYEGSGEK